MFDPLIPRILTAIDSAKNIAGAYLTCPPAQKDLVALVAAVGMMFDHRTDAPQTCAHHLIVNQFDVFWPKEMWSQAYEHMADVWMRCSPSDHFMAVLCLYGAAKIKAAGYGSFPTLMPGELIVLPANMYYAIGDALAPMACTITLVL